jgi:hypothetical protein
MRIVLNSFGILLAGAGLVWTLQGANILPGSFMTGQPFWLVTGLICLGIGAGLLVFANRQRGAPPPGV